MSHLLTNSQGVILTLNMSVCLSNPNDQGGFYCCQMQPVLIIVRFDKDIILLLLFHEREKERKAQKYMTHTDAVGNTCCDTV